SNDLYGTGVDGGHGGSRLSSLGGTIRLGELVSGGVIRHVMKVNVYGLNNYYYDGTTQGYRWPASQADGCAATCYGGTVPALRMGSLLTIPASVNIDNLGLETEPAKILARAFQDYGAYAVDDTAWSVYAIATEFSPQGRVDDEFSTAWGFPINAASKGVPWARDMDRLFGALNVVDNWDEAQWLTVSGSNGAQGAHPPRSARGLTLRNPTPCRRPRTEGPRAGLGDTFPRKSSRTNRPTPSIRSFRRIPKPSRRERAPPRFRPTVSKLYVSPV